MGEVVPFAPREIPSPAAELSDLIEVYFIGAIGGILIVMLAARGNETSGPYHVTLRSDGVPDACLLTVTRGGNATADEFMTAALHHAIAIHDALLYADQNAHLLPSQLPPVPEPA